MRLRDYILGLALLYLIFASISALMWRPEPPLLVEVPEPDMAHNAAAPFCTIPGPPKPLERDRANPLEVRSLA